MIDHFSILLSHVLLTMAFWRLLHRPDLDQEVAPPTLAEQVDATAAPGAAAPAAVRGER